MSTSSCRVGIIHHGVPPLHPRAVFHAAMIASASISTSMSREMRAPTCTIEVAGRMSVQVGAQYLERPNGGPMDPKVDAALNAPPDGVQVWSACIAGQQSYELDDEPEGVFIRARLPRRDLVRFAPFVIAEAERKRELG